MNLEGKHALILGLGESGLAMAAWCARLGGRVRVADTRSAPPALAELAERVPAAEFVCADFIKSPEKRLLEAVDLLAISPGLSGGMLLALEARARGIPVLGEIELFARALRQLQPAGGARAPSRLIAITGTNGKTTTTVLTGHLCRAAGLDAEVAGNISPSALAALMARLDSGVLPDVWVLELSSFQLETVHSLDAEAATVLNISDDHLDRYIDVDDYAAAKQRIFQGGGVQVLNRQDPRVKKMAITGRRMISFGLDTPGVVEDFGLRENRGGPWLVQGDRFLLPLAEMPLAGLHNAANAAAALALCHAVGLPLLPMIEALRSFRGLPHRVQLVAESEGVGYYDDSKGTNVGATVAALYGLATGSRKIVLIAGGEGKGQDFSPLAKATAQCARAVVLIGRDAGLLETALGASGVPTQRGADMEEAVALAASAARCGDVVLLSPACASFDMYRNYVHRAEVFIAAVEKRMGSAAGSLAQ